MPDPISMKKLLNELSSTGGGSLVKTVVKAEITSAGKILVIGLGGMGCKTVNATKGVYLRDFKDTGRIDFLAVDTDMGDMAELNVQNGGSLTLNDMFQIYDSAADDLLTERPPIVRAWLSEDAPKEKIIGDGAKQCRAVGRAMLCATQKYEALRTTISSKIEGLKLTASDILQVVIVAGISGGTGSGTFIDVSYMTRILLDELNATKGINSKMYGVFYTPDVQKSVPDIGGDSARWANLQRNGYAALKELDYFMNVGGQALTEDVYSIRTLSGTYKSHQRVFERGHVYIVSPTTSCRECESIVATTAESLIDLFRQGQTDGAVTVQSLLSELSNNTALGTTWDNNTVGVVADQAKPADPCGIKNTLHPAFMNYNFSALGVRSIYFPRNEMVAYCANEAFLAIFNEWKRAFNYTQANVNAAAQSCRIDSADSIFAFAASMPGAWNGDFRIKPDDGNYPIRKGFAGAGKVIGTADTISESTAKVDRVINTITQDICDGIINTITDSIRGKFEDQNFLWNSGPLAAIVLLSGNEGRLKGFIQLLEDSYRNISVAINSKKDAMDKAVSALGVGKQTIDTDHSPHDEEIEAFVDLCEKYAQAYFEYTFYSKFMTYIIKGVREKLIKFNNETFEIYVPILHSVMEMLSKDATAFAEDTLNENVGGGSTYSLNAFALNDARRQNNLFSTLFEGYIDQEKVNAVKREFVASLFDPRRKAIWQNISNNPEALAAEIRDIFKVVSGSLISQMLEKLMVMVYGKKDDIVKKGNGVSNITIKDINAVWEDVELRDNALRSAAKNIVDVLTGSIMLKHEIDDPQTLEKFSKKATVILLNETPLLNAAIEAELNSRFGNNGFTAATMGDDTTCEYKTNITMAMQRTFIPLAMVSNIQNYAREYFRSEQSLAGQAGRHLDEVTERWQDNLPEIFGLDTEAYYLERGKLNHVITDEDRATDEKGIRNQDKRMYDIIRDAVDYGVKNGYIRISGDSFQLLKLTDTSEEFLATLEERLLEMKKQNPAAEWTDALILIENELHVKKSKLVDLDADLLNDKLRTNKTIMPDNDYDIKNIYRLVRSDMRKVKLVVEAKKFYEDTDFFYNMDSLASLRGNVALFIKALKVDAISYDEQSGWFCKYSDSQYEPPVKFFDDYMRKNDKLDVPFKWYLVFSAFVKNIAGKEVIVEGIETKFEQIERDRAEYAAWDYVIDELKAAMDSEIIRIRDVKIRNDALEPYYLNSNYKEYYCVPKKYRGPQTLIDNFNKIIAELEYCKKFMIL